MALWRAFRAAILSPSSSGGTTYLDDGVLVVDPQGVITRVAAWGDPLPAPVTVLDLRGSLVVPGFVDTHLHFPQTRVIGSAAGPLLSWLSSTVFPEEARFRDESYARTVADEFIAHCFAAGTTCVSAFSSSSPQATQILLESMQRSSLSGFAGLTLMDQNCPPELSLPRERALAASRELASRFPSDGEGRVHFAVTPRFALSCSRALMEQAAELAAELGLWVQTHVAENPREGEETLRAHPYADNYLGVYAAVGLLGPRTILAHAIHLSASEWDVLAASGASVAHCPDSNLFLNSGRMRLSEARARRVRVGLGSDVAAGRSFDLRRAISHAYDNAQLAGSEVTDEQLFTLATLDGARALGLEARCGSLEPGKDGDFVVLERPSHAHGRAGALRCVGFGAELAPLLATYVRGRCVHRRSA